MREKMQIRLATPEDSSALLEIYSQYIETQTTFEYALPSKQEFTKRIAGIGRDYPYLVCECMNERKIIGYAYAHRAMLRAAYQWNAELSIYLDRNFISRGLGKKLYACLIELLKPQGIRTVLASVTAHNPRSDALHKSFGFEIFGIYRNAGYKCSDWHDVIIYGKQIAPYDNAPKPLIPFSKLPQEQIAGIIARFNQSWQPQ